MLLMVVKMLKKRLGAEGIEKVWNEDHISYYYKIPSSLIIPEGCERIGVCAFLECRRLKKVSIPGSVKKIRYGAFWGCEKLIEVIIPEGVERIGYRAFEGCKELEKVIVPKSVKFIGDCAFIGCDKATIILKKRKKDFEEIGDKAFSCCKYVKEETRN